MDRIKKTYTIAVIIGVAMIMTLFAYVLLVEIMSRTMQPPAKTPEGIGTLKTMLLVMSAVNFLIIKIVQKIILSPKATPRRPLTPEGKLLASTIIAYAIAETPAIYGLLMFFMTFNTAEFYIFLGISALFFVIYFPRYSRWREWIRNIKQ